MKSSVTPPFALVLAFVLCGCGPAWVRPPGVTDDQYRQDQRGCDRVALQVPPPPPPIPRTQGFFEDPWRAWFERGAQERAYRECMEAKGYRLPP